MAGAGVAKGFPRHGFGAAAADFAAAVAASDLWKMTRVGLKLMAEKLRVRLTRRFPPSPEEGRFPTTLLRRHGHWTTTRRTHHDHWHASA